jgi:organic radical activating enzyme
MIYDTAREIIGFLKSKGLDSIHIGGGEPFLDIDGLYDVLRVAQSENMHIVYLETNSSWYKNHDQAVSIIKHLQKLGLDTLLLSVDPFHNEFIDFDKVKGVMRACDETDMGTFLWQRKYHKYIDDMGSGKHTLSEYNKKYGDVFIENVVMSYGMSANGRAINLLSKFIEKRSLSDVLSDSCPELAVADDFHIDLYLSLIHI